MVCSSGMLINNKTKIISLQNWNYLGLNVTGGNAGLAAAYSARKLNVPCTIVVPGTTPMFLVERLREEGATVEICGKVSCMLTLFYLNCIWTLSVKIHIKIINRAAMGQARFLIYPWFIYFFFVCRLNQTSLGQNSNDAIYVGDQTQTSIRPNRVRDFESRNLWCLFTKSC